MTTPSTATLAAASAALIRTERYRLVEWRNAGERVTLRSMSFMTMLKGEVETVNIAAKNPALVKALAGSH